MGEKEKEKVSVVFESSEMIVDFNETKINK